MENRIVTVFGGAGFVGRYLVQQLAARGLRVRVAMRRPDEGLFLRAMGDVGQIELVQANLRNAPSVAAAIAGADYVVNLVGVLYPRGAQSFAAVHARGGQLVAEAAARAGVQRLVQVSAIGAAADSPSLYARSKAAGEAAVLRAFPKATIVRPSIVFGPEDDFFNRFAALARILWVLPLIGGGQNRMQPVYVGDVATALARVLLDGDSSGKTFELGGPRVFTFKEILELVLHETGRSALLLPLPVPVAMMQAAVLELLPIPPLLTRDQVRLLQQDNVASAALPGLDALGIVPTPVEAVIPTYLQRYRRGGGRLAPRFG